MVGEGGCREAQKRLQMDEIRQISGGLRMKNDQMRLGASLDIERFKESPELEFTHLG